MRVTENWLGQCLKSIDAMSADDVSKKSQLAAKMLLAALFTRDCRPKRLFSTADRTIVLYVWGPPEGATRVRVECDDDGEYVVSVLAEHSDRHVAVKTAEQVCNLILPKLTPIAEDLK